MTTLFLCITHGWLWWGFADILGQQYGGGGNKCCRMKLDLKLSLCHILTQSALPVGQPAHLANPAIFFAANVYAENTWTEFELPYDVGLYLAVTSCWQQGLPQTIQSIPSAQTHNLLHQLLPTPPQPPFRSYLSLYLSIFIYLTHTFRNTHNGSHT